MLDQLCLEKSKNDKTMQGRLTNFSHYTYVIYISINIYPKRMHGSYHLDLHICML